MSQAARCYVEISRSRIAANYRAVRDAVGPETQIMGVVKANAYGHGAVEVARVLAAEGAKWLAVSSVDEGVTLRAAGINCRVLIMAGVMRWEHEALREFRLTPVAHSLDDLRRFDEERPARGSPQDRHGDEPAGHAPDSSGDRGHDCRLCAMCGVEGLLSHFASAADFTSAQTEEQIREFNGIWQELAGLGVRPALMHFASTNAIAYPRRGAWLSLVRPGHAIYGYVSPARGAAPPPVLAVKPALSWRTRIVSVKECRRGRRWATAGRLRLHRRCAWRCWRQDTRTAFRTGFRTEAK